jgi:hypothetical protein
MRFVGGGIEVRRAYSEYLYRGRYDESIPCVLSGRLEGTRVRLGIKDKVVLLLSTPTFCSTFTRSLLPWPCCVTHLPLQAIHCPTAESPSCRNPCPGDRAFFQPILSVLDPSSTRPSERTVCCSCISRNQILKMLPQEQYLSHGCLHFEEAKAHVY